MDRLEAQLFALCGNYRFNKDQAVDLMKKVDLNKVFEIEQNSEYAEDAKLATFLHQAAWYENYEMFKLLLENGADPDVYVKGEMDTVLCALRTPTFSSECNEVHLKMVQLLLEHGVSTEVPCGEDDLFTKAVLNAYMSFTEPDWEYYCRYLILLVSYGKSSEICRTEIIKPFNKKNMKRYRFDIDEKAGSKRLSNRIIDGRRSLIATIEDYQTILNAIMKRDLEHREDF